MTSAFFDDVAMPRSPDEDGLPAVAAKGAHSPLRLPSRLTQSHQLVMASQCSILVWKPEVYSSCKEIGFLWRPLFRFRFEMVLSRLKRGLFPSGLGKWLQTLFRTVTVSSAFVFKRSTITATPKTKCCDCFRAKKQQCGR